MKGKRQFRLFILLGSLLLAGLNLPAQSETMEEELSTLLWSKMSTCWATVQDLPEPSRLTVVVYIELDREGRLIGEPEVLSPTEVEPFDDAMRTAVVRAIRAAKVCAPYDLPSEHYRVWRNVTLRFKHIAAVPEAAS